MNEKKANGEKDTEGETGQEDRVEENAWHKNVRKIVSGRRKGGLLSYSFKMPALYFQMGHRLI